MYAIISIKTSDQDMGLASAFDAGIQGRQWEPVPHIPFSYVKSFSTDSEDTVQEQVAKDMDGACFEAEWKAVRFVLVLSATAPRVMQTP